MIKFISTPVEVTIGQYHESIDRMIAMLMSFQQVSAVYQIGSVSVPGISDVDIVVVFKDGEMCNFNPLEGLTAGDKYLFVHSLFGLCESQFKTINDFLIQVQYIYKTGSKIAQKAFSLSEQQRRELNTQIALEYLVKNFMSASIQQKIGVVKLRSLLLEVNALKYDFELLGITQGKLFELVYELIDWRKKWFIQNPSEQKISSWFNEYCSELNKLLQHLFQTHVLYSPFKSPVVVNKTSSLINSEVFSVNKSGIAVPMIPGMKPMHLYKIGTRINSVKLKLPMKIPETGSIHHKRFSRLQELRDYNKKYLPHFMPMVSVLPFTR